MRGSPVLAVNQTELIVDLVDSRHELVVLNHILRIDRPELLITKDTLLKKTWHHSFQLIGFLIELVLAAESDPQLLEQRWASMVFD